MKKPTFQHGKISTDNSTSTLFL
uniref:Uncharacterized protein n=1 Tax=Anguilla anguilla TaxID=7936 RepID=A0A0E9U679_ANGAN